MGRKINYIDPVESVQGLLGSKQDLQYAENNNRAFESPAGQRNYARNYSTRFVGLKRARDGKKYYAVRKKSAFTASSAALKACALLSCARSIYGEIKKNLATYTSVQSLYNRYVADGGTETLYRWTFKQIYEQLKHDAENLIIAYADVTTKLGGNPFGTTTPRAPIGQNVLVKFWEYMRDGNVYFYINGQKGIAFNGAQFSDIIDDDVINVLSLTTRFVSGQNLLCYSTYDVTDEDGVSVTTSSYVAAEYNYRLK